MLEGELHTGDIYPHNEEGEEEARKAALSLTSAGRRAIEEEEALHLWTGYKAR